MSQSLQQSHISTPDNIKITKTTPYRSAGITKTLLTPCRRLGLSRKIKTTPTPHNQSSPNTSITSTLTLSSTPVSALKIQESPIVTPSPKQSEKPHQKRSFGGSSRANIQSRFGTQDVEKPVSSNLTVDENEYNKLSDANEPKRDGKILKHASKIQENSITIPSLKRRIGGSSRANIQSRFETEDVKKPVSNNFTVDENECKKLSDANERKRDGKILKHKKPPRKENKSNSTNVVSSVDSKNFQSEVNTLQQSCVKTEPPRKTENKKIEPKHSDINTTTSSAPKKNFKRCLSMKKSSCSQDELTDVDDLLSTPKTSSTSLLSGEFLKECNVKEDRMMGIVEESDEQIKVVPGKKRCIVYSSDEDDFASSQNSRKKDNNQSQKIQDVDWQAKVIEIKKQIKKKETRLADLKQAVVYRKLHNVKELENSVKTWKKCCEEGLMHLLPKLQEHGQMEMALLIKSLNIPKSIVYDANTDSFM